MKQFSNKLDAVAAVEFYDETMQFIEDNVDDLMTGRDGGAILIMTACDNKLRPTLFGGDENSIAEMLTDIVMQHPGMASRAVSIISKKYGLNVTDITEEMESMGNVSRSH